MTLPKLDQTKPPPGWEFDDSEGGRFLVRVADVYEPDDTNASDALQIHRAHIIYAEESAPAVDDALARLVEWLRDKARGKDGTVIHTVDASYDVRVADALADAIESGGWRND